MKELEQLVAVTRDLFDIDRDLMYYNLLRAYAKIGDVDRALEVWTSLQEENINPSDRTLRFLADFLKEQGREVPFVVPPNRSLPSVSSTIFAYALERQFLDAVVAWALMIFLCGRLALQLE